MRPIYENTVIQIEVTNACHLSCANCTRHVGHHRRPFFMDLGSIRTAIRSLDGFGGRVGIMGGEPCLHPEFPAILDLVREEIPDRRRREFWTAGFKWAEYKDVITETFDKDRIAFNNHLQHTGKHQPLLVAIDEVVEDKALRKLLISNCPFQARWSASITPKGAFFCEIAGSLDWLFDGPGGYPVEPGWWRKRRHQFQDQVKEYCGKCSGALPLKAFSDGRGGVDGPTVDQVSPGNLERLIAAGSPKAKAGNIKVWDEKISSEDIVAGMKGWEPRSFRDFEAHAPEDYDTVM